MGFQSVLTRELGAVLKSARKALGLTQQELATRAGVSVRLWAEVERGIRPNVSLATALCMLQEAGLAIKLEDAAGTVHEVLRAQSETGAPEDQSTQRSRSSLRASVFQLGAEPNDDLSATTTVEQRIEIVEVLSRRMWELSGRSVPVYSRSTMPVFCVRRS